MRIQLPTVDIDLLTLLRDSIGIAAAHIEENWDEADWAGVLQDLSTLGNAFGMQVDYAERNIRVTIKPLVGVFRTRNGNLANPAAILEWKLHHPYVRPPIVNEPKTEPRGDDEPSST